MARKISKLSAIRQKILEDYLKDREKEGKKEQVNNLIKEIKVEDEKDTSRVFIDRKSGACPYIGVFGSIYLKLLFMEFIIWDEGFELDPRFKPITDLNFIRKCNWDYDKIKGKI